MNGYENIPAGTTTFGIPRSYEEIKKSVEDYARENIINIFDLGFKIKDNNIFWVMMMKEKVTKQIAFTLMIGKWTLINYCSEARE